VTAQPASPLQGREARRWCRVGRCLAAGRPSAAIGAIVLGLVASQAAAGGLILAAGGDHAPDALAALALMVADLVILGVVVLFVRREAERLTPATLLAAAIVLAAALL
jgi:hypothetical protein